MYYLISSRNSMNTLKIQIIKLEVYKALLFIYIHLKKKIYRYISLIQELFFCSKLKLKSKLEPMYDTIIDIAIPKKKKIVNF